MSDTDRQLLLVLLGLQKERDRYKAALEAIRSGIKRRDEDVSTDWILKRIAVVLPESRRSEVSR